MGRPPAKGHGNPSSSVMTVSLGTILDTAFDDIFISEVPASAFSAAVRSYLTQNAELMVMDATDLAEQHPCTPAVYFALWPQFLRDVIDACQFHYCPQLRRTDSISQKRPRYLPVSLRVDVATSMASSGNCGDVMVSDVAGRELEKIFQTWSAIHPLAPCIAIENLAASSAVSRALRHLVICEAKEVAGETQAGDSQQHFDYALQSLRSQGIHIYDDVQDVLSTVTTLLHTCQAALLFGWRALSHNQARHGTTYMAAAGQVMGRLQTLAAGQAGFLPATLLDRVRTASSLFALTTVWAFSQLDRSTGELGFSLQLPHSRHDPGRAFDETLALLSSALLNAHPNILSGSAMEDLDGTSDLQDIIRQQLTWIELQRHVSNGEDDALQALRDTFRLILISAKDASQIDEAIPAFLDTARTAIGRMKRLAGQKNESMNRPVLSRIAFQPPAGADNTESRVRKTLASYLFELLAAMLEYFSVHMSTDDVQDLCRSLQEAHLNVVETETFSFAKAQIDRVASSRMGDMGNGSTVSTLPSSTFSSPFATDVSTADTSPDREGDVDLYTLLWGYVPWSDTDSEARHDWNKV